MLFQFFLIKLSHLETRKQEKDSSRRLIVSPHMPADCKPNHNNTYKQTARKHHPFHDAIFRRPSQPSAAFLHFTGHFGRNLPAQTAQSPYHFPQYDPCTQIHHLYDKQYRHKPRRVIVDELVTMHERLYEQRPQTDRLAHCESGGAHCP